MTTIKYHTTNHEDLKFEMRELTDRQLQNVYHNNDPWSTARAIHGEASKARHVAAYIEIKARRAK